MNAIASINRYIDEKFDYDDDNDELLAESLLNTNSHLEDININLISLYKKLFFKLKSDKMKNSDENNNENFCDKNSAGFINLLTHSEIQESISSANVLYEKEYLSKIKIYRVNFYGLFFLGLALLKDSVGKEDFTHTLYLIKNLNFKNTKIIDENAYIYHFELAEYLYVSFFVFFSHNLYIIFLNFRIIQISIQRLYVK